MFIHMHHTLLIIYIVLFFFPLVCDIHYVFSSSGRRIFEMARRKRQKDKKEGKDQLVSLTLTTTEKDKDKKKWKKKNFITRASDRKCETTERDKERGPFLPPPPFHVSVAGKQRCTVLSMRHTHTHTLTPYLICNATNHEDSFTHTHRHNVLLRNSKWVILLSLSLFSVYLNILTITFPLNDQFSPYL